MHRHHLDDLSRELARGSSRRGVLKLLGGGLVGGAVVASGLGPVAAKGKRSKPNGTNPFADIPVHGNVGPDQPFKGLLTITQFSTDGQQLFADGTLSGQYQSNQGWQTLDATDVTGIPVALPRSSGHSTSAAKARGVQAAATCPILHLTLGPVDLNLLGLTVHLNQVVLNIDAQSGPGNLLGNLLCGIAGLLDQGLPLNQLLQQIVDLLNGVLAGL